jgi:hypothetical protein
MFTYTLYMAVKYANTIPKKMSWNGDKYIHFDMGDIIP